MDDGVRGRGHLLSARPSSAPLLAALFVVSCGAPPARPRTVAPAPVSTHAAPAPAPSTLVTDAPPPAFPRDPGPPSVPIDSTFRSSLRLLAADKLSLGHAGGRWRATIHGNDAGERAWRGPGRVAERTALLVAEHTGDGEAGPVLVMQKRGAGYDDARGDWYYAVLTPELRPMREGRLADCAACHGLAKRDHVFGE